MPAKLQLICFILILNFYIGQTTWLLLAAGLGGGAYYANQQGLFSSSGTDILGSGSSVSDTSFPDLLTRVPYCRTRSTLAIFQQLLCENDMSYIIFALSFTYYHMSKQSRRKEVSELTSS